MTTPTANPLRTRLAAGESLIGIWSIIPSATLAEVIGAAGMDFQILDMEHGFYSLPQLEASIRASEAIGCAPLVRPPSLNQDIIQAALDLGAHGIVVPQVSDATAARAAVAALRFPMHGRRGFNPFTRVGGYGLGRPVGQATIADGWAFSAVIVESVQAFQDLDRIVALPDLDMVYLGVYDMSVALGCPGETMHPRVLHFVEQATKVSRAAGKAVGVLARSEDELARFMDLGANMLVYVVDTYVIGRAMGNAVEQFRRARDRQGGANR